MHNNNKVFKSTDLFNGEMLSLLEDKVDRFYKEISYVKKIRAHLKDIKDKYSFYITSTISIKDGSVCETYFFHNKVDCKVFMSFVMNGYLITTLHRRLVSTPKSIKFFNSFIESVKSNSMTELFTPLLSLFTLAFTLGGNDFLLDSHDDSDCQYLVLEAIKSKLTAEFFLFI